MFASKEPKSRPEVSVNTQVLLTNLQLLWNPRAQAADTPRQLLWKQHQCVFPLKLDPFIHHLRNDKTLSEIKRYF